MLWSGDGYAVTDDIRLLDLDAAYAFLRDSYWARGLPRDVFDRSVRGSLCFGLLCGSELAGFCRAVTDRATFAYVADVFVLPKHRGKGLALRMLSCVRAHPELHGLRRWLLATADAHGLYSKLGFAPLPQPESFMEILTPYRG